MDDIFRLVILSDCTDVAVNEIRFSIDAFFGAGRKGFVIEPSVAIAPWSILNGSFLIRLLAESAPKKTVLYAVINPLPDSFERVIGVCKTREIAFVGRNTGVFGWLAQDFGIKKLIEISQDPYVAFGGKNIYPKAVAAAIRGDHLDSLGPALDHSAIRDIERVPGTILHIDNFGIAKFVGKPSGFAQQDTPIGKKFFVRINGRECMTARYVKQLTAAETGEWVVYDGSSLGGLPEMAQVRANGTRNFGLQIGDRIELIPAP
jgi:S-adenosylmethionine hydrolase